MEHQGIGYRQNSSGRAHHLLWPAALLDSSPKSDVLAYLMLGIILISTVGLSVLALVGLLESVSARGAHFPNFDALERLSRSVTAHHFRVGRYDGFVDRRLERKVAIGTFRNTYYQAAASRCCSDFEFSEDGSRRRVQEQASLRFDKRSPKVSRRPIRRQSP